MDNSSNSEKNHDVALEDKMELLEIKEEVACSSTSSESPKRRSLRKRVPTLNKVEKRRVLIKPQKRLNTGSSSTEDVSQIYLCKKFKRLPPTLETIFEEPKISKSNEVLYAELKKKKRVLVFNSNNEGKLKKRQQKIKKFFGKSVFKKKQSSIDLLLQKLCDVEQIV